MRLRIVHRTTYGYDAPVSYALSRLRKEPQSGPTQDVLSWHIHLEGAVADLRYPDHFGNLVTLIRADGAVQSIGITAEGEVETRDTAGIVGRHTGPAPLWLYLQPTPLTEPGARVEALARQVAEAAGLMAPVCADDETLPDLPPNLPDHPQALGLLHALSAAVADQVVWQTGQTDIATAAEDALAAGTGVCQDQAHVFIAAARRFGFPARYVGGYFAMEGDGAQVAGHAWAEAHVPGLGWVGFDVANRVSPDERHVRVALGQDYVDVSPVAGMRYGQAVETMGVELSVVPQDAAADAEAQQQ